MKNIVVKSKIWEKIRRELHPSHLFRSRHLIPAIISGALVGFMTTLLSISFAVLVFGKAIPEALSIGIGMALFSNVIFHLGSALGSSGEGVIYHVQSLPPPIQAVMLSSIMGALPLTLSIEDRTVVAVLAIWFSAIFTGITLFFLGHLKLGRFVRFLPLPVISGFLASVGMALVLGGIKTMVSIEVTLSSLSSLFSISLMVKWLPGIALAVVLWIVTARWKHQLVLPNTLGIAVVLFYAVCAAQGWSMADMMAGKLLLGPFPYGGFWQSPEVYYSQIHLVDWTIIASQIGTIVTIPLVCFIAGLLMLSAIEFSTGSEVEPNFDLETMGISNFISGIVGGGFVGYPSTTFTVMQHNLGASTRLSGILSALIPLIVLGLGASFLGYIPRFVVGGLLIYFGYQFIDYWIIKQLRQASLSHICVLSSIVVTSLWLGFVPSVGVGILVAILFFLFEYSQTSIIREMSTGALLRSSVMRNTVQADWLATHGDSLSIFELQGYIFFGTAYNLQEEILSRVTDTHQTPLNCVILDFRHVTGIDTSVAQSFHRLYVQLMRKDITLIFAQMPPKYKGLMQKTGFIKESTKGFAEFTRLDEALEWCENHLLENSNLPSYPTRPLLDVFTEHFNDRSKAEILLRYSERLNVLAGTKIIQQNTIADDLFFIESGRLSIYSEQEGSLPMRLQTMGEDNIVGEMGLYLDTLHTTTVMADESSTVYRFSIDALTKLEKEQPLVAIELHKLVVKKTVKRIKDMSKNVKGFME
jgi:sulfate permease, SulP family